MISRLSIPILLTLICGLLIHPESRAQDSLHTRDGRVIAVQVVKMSRHQLHYREWKAGDTSERHKDLHLIRRIAFAEGRSWPPNRQERLAEAERVDSLRRLRSISSPNFNYAIVPAFQLIGKGIGIAGGIGYERRLPTKRRLSVVTSVMAFATTTLHAKIERSSTELTGVYVCPGFQCHLRPGRKGIEPSFGLEFPTGLIHHRDIVYERGNYLGTTTQKYLLLAIAPSVAVRAPSSKLFTIMFRASGGPVLVHPERYSGVVQGGFCLGLRY